MSQQPQSEVLRELSRIAQQLTGFKTDAVSEEALARTPRGLLPVMDLEVLFRGDDLSGASAALERLRAAVARG